MGDKIFVSGSIGDANLGLRVLHGELNALSESQTADLKACFLRPRPRIELGQALVGTAHSATDVSDGLVADVGHLCARAGVGAHLDVSLIPLSKGTLAALDIEPNLLPDLLSSGDDYELVFTAPEGKEDVLSRISSNTGVAITEIGRIVETPGVLVFNSDGTNIQFVKAGYQHF